MPTPSNTIDISLTDFNPAPPALANDGHDLYIDPETADFQMVSGIDMVKQAVGIALWWFAGEWAFDTSTGWISPDTMGSKYNAAAVSARIKSVILAVPDVNRILSYSQSFDSSTRKLSVAFTFDTAYGIADMVV